MTNKTLHLNDSRLASESGSLTSTSSIRGDSVEYAD